MLCIYCQDEKNGLDLQGSEASVSRERQKIGTLITQIWFNQREHRKTQRVFYFFLTRRREDEKIFFNTDYADFTDLYYEV